MTHQPPTGNVPAVGRRAVEMTDARAQLDAARGHIDTACCHLYDAADTNPRIARAMDTVRCVLADLDDLREAM